MKLFIVLLMVLGTIGAAAANERVFVINAGATNYVNSQVATSTVAATLVVARETRRGCLVRNLDTTISVYIGAATVTSANGMLLKAGESVVIQGKGLYQVISASGTPTVAVMDEYD